MTDITEKNNSTALSAVFILARARGSVGQMNFACVLGFLRADRFSRWLLGWHFFLDCTVERMASFGGIHHGISGVGTVND